jgi:hypothetical protein
LLLQNRMAQEIEYGRAQPYMESLTRGFSHITLKKLPLEVIVEKLPAFTRWRNGAVTRQVCYRAGRQ